MWSDNETSEDLLGFKVHADLIIDLIKDDSVLPVTIGIFGDWGSGKSSILKIITEELSGEDEELVDGTLVMYFNGWVFEGYDDAKAALLESIVEKFERHKKLGSKVKKKTVNLIRSVKWMRALGFGFKKIAIPTAAAYFTGGISLIPFLLQEFSNFKPEELAKKLTGEKADEFLKEVLSKQQEEDSTLVRQFRQDFKEMIEASEIKKLVVIIDDLDRCTPDRIIENLEAIKLFLNVEKTAFIIGADPRIVRHAIEQMYKTDSIENASDPDSRNKRIVSDYLEKLIQVPYTLPPLSHNEVETYLTLLFCKRELGDSFKKVLEAFCEYRLSNRYGAFGLGNLVPLLVEEEQKKLSTSVSLIASLSSIITEGLNGNPRQIKRFLNTFTLRQRLVEVAKIPDFKFDVLAKIMVLEYSKPDLFKKLYEWQVIQNGEPKELLELETFASESNKEEIKSKYSIDWGSDKVVKWLSIDPKLSNIDLRDYYWVSRDQLSGSISGSSLVPVHIRLVFKEIFDYGSDSILKNDITSKVSNKLSEFELEALMSLFEKELSKTPENDRIHKIYIEFIAQKVPLSMQSYSNVIQKIDHSNIPFSLSNHFELAENHNPDIKNLYSMFNPKSNIGKRLNKKVNGN